MNPTPTLSILSTLSTLSTLALLGGLPAQSPAVFPSDHATFANGASSQNFFPYAYGVSRMMAVYESWDLTVPNGHQITRIGFRADGTTVALGKQLNLQVRMGQTDRTATTLLSTFDNNWFGTPVTVFGPGLFAMPDLNNAANPNPGGDVVWLTLATPYTYDSSRNLLIEWQVLANNNGGAAFSYPLDRALFLSPVVSGPQGCPHSGNQTPDLESRPTKVGGNWILELYQGPASQPVLLFVNVGLPLSPSVPLGLLLPGVGATCTAQLSPTSLFSIGTTTNTGGYASLTVPLPNDRIFNDLILSSQAFCFDFFAPGGIAVSNGDQVQVGIEPAMSILYHQGSATNATGSVQQNFGAITLFAHN